jgi:hypothetical protein
MNKKNITIAVTCLLVIAGLLSTLYRTELKSAAMRIGLFPKSAENKQTAGHQHGSPSTPTETLTNSR